MKLNFCFFLLFFFSLSVLSQASPFSGKVKLKNGKPVANATVAIEKLNAFALTEDDGSFKFGKIKHGRYKVVVFSLEINKKEFDIELGKDSKSFVFEVEPSQIDLNEVVVSANSVKKTIETKGFAVNVIETQKIATQSIQTNELLDRTAGVRVRQDGGLGSHITYNINGLSGNAVKVFIDGVPSSNFGSSFSLNSIPPSLIERIEIYKGVVPGYLSEDALGGAINIILKERRKNSLTTSYSFGSFNTHQWNATGNQRWDNGLTIDGSLFYNYSDNDYKVWGDDIEFKKPGGGIIYTHGKTKVKRFNDAYESLGGKFNFGFTNVSWADQLLIGGVFSKDYKEIQNGTTMKLVYGDRHTKRNSGVVTLSYNKNDFLIEGLSLKLDANHSYLKRQVIDTVGYIYDWNGRIQDTNGEYIQYNGGSQMGDYKTAAINIDHVNMARANLSYRVHKNHILYASYLFNDFEREVSDEYQAAAIQQLRNTRDLQKRTFSFTYENLAFSNKLRTNLFYKHYFQKVTSNEPYLDSKTKEYDINVIQKEIDYNGYGITLSYALRPNLYLLGSAEKALRLPNANELFGNDSENLLASPTLEPEKSFNANIGVNYDIKFNKHTVGINTSVFYRDTQGMIRQGFHASSFTTSQFENLEDVLSKGIDAEVNYAYTDKINFRFNVSKFDVLFNTKYDKKGDPYQYYRKQVRNEPSFKFNANLTYLHKDLFLKKSKTAIFYNINYVKGFSRHWPGGSRNLDLIPDQYPMDLGITYTFPKNKVVLGLDAKNILNQQVYDNFGLQKPGRAFYAKITYFIL